MAHSLFPRSTGDKYRSLAAHLSLILSISLLPVLIYASPAVLPVVDRLGIDVAMSGAGGEKIGEAGNTRVIMGSETALVAAVLLGRIRAPGRVEMS
jgi:hypothetical protein